MFPLAGSPGHPQNLGQSSKTGMVWSQSMYPLQAEYGIFYHLFVDCRFGKDIWDIVCVDLHINDIWDVGDFGSCLLNWSRSSKSHLLIPIFVLWIIWYARNCAIFNGRVLEVKACGLSVLKMAHFYNNEKLKPISSRISLFSFIVNQSVLFFDGAAQHGLCAAGGVIFLNKDHYFTLGLNCGFGTNMKADPLALWCVMKTANIFGLVDLKVYGDSRVIIKWASKEFNLQVLALHHWCWRTRAEIDKCGKVIFEHIYREQNDMADKLSKLAFDGIEGYLLWEEWYEQNVLDNGAHFIFGDS